MFMVLRGWGLGYRAEERVNTSSFSKCASLTIIKKVEAKIRFNSEISLFTEFSLPKQFSLLFFLACWASAVGLQDIV